MDNEQNNKRYCNRHYEVIALIKAHERQCELQFAQIERAVVMAKQSANDNIDSRLAILTDVKEALKTLDDKIESLQDSSSVALGGRKWSDHIITSLIVIAGILIVAALTTRGG